MKYGITPKLFVFAWQTSATPSQAANYLSSVTKRVVTREYVLARAARYRRQGVMLKSMSREKVAA